METAMTNASRPAFLRSFGHPVAPRAAPDPADMGTAFALDEALENGSYDSRPSAESPPMRASVPVAPWRLWLGRKLSA
jgi:hypothetical protein